MKSVLYIFIILFLFPFSAFSQKNKKYLNKADKYYASLQYKLAIPYYLEVVKKDSSEKVLARLAEAYGKTKDYPEALKWYTKLILSKPENPENVLRYAESLANNNDYKAAGYWYKRYNELNPADERGKLFAGLYNNHNFFADSAKWKIGYVSINSVRADFSPVFFKGGLMFTSNRSPGTAQKRIFGWDGNPFTDIYLITDTTLIRILEGEAYSRRREQAINFKINSDDTPASANDSKTFGNVSEIRVKDGTSADFSVVKKVAGLNSKYHDGPVTFADNGSWGMFCRNGKKKGKSSSGRIKMFSAKYAGGSWYNIKPFDYNSDRYSCGHPALSGDGSVLYFVSDMPGGYGGTDVYYCLKTDSGWTKPKNLGRSVNTEGDEMFPYLDNLGNLYFASNGLPGLGGLDIFKIQLKDHLPLGSPQNLGYPLNSSSDDFGLITAESQPAGYFSSNRLGNDDIYKFTSVRRKLQLDGFVYEKFEGAKRGVERATLIVKAGASSDTLNSDGAGKFHYTLDAEKDYKLEASKDGYLAATASFSTRSLNGQDSLRLTMEMSKLVPPNEEITLDQVPTDNPRFKNIYYHFDKYSIRNSDRQVLDSLANYLLENPSAAIVATSHTDSRGSFAYNLALSKKRSNSVKAYLVSRGVNARRITVRSYGEAKPANKCGKCTDKDRQLDRRTEFEIIPTQ